MNQNERTIAEALSRCRTIPGDWDQRARMFGSGLTVVRSDQCPYLDDGVNFTLEVAEVLGLQAKVVELQSAQEVRERAPSPYGVFCILLDGVVISDHYQLRAKLIQLLEQRRNAP